ncbi:MAG: formate/nitrite transporter FocA (FNT family) [Halobacteriales archaeon]
MAGLVIFGAIVIDDLGPIDALKHSLAVVRHNLMSTLRYTVIVGILGGMVGVATNAATILASTQPSSPYEPSQLSKTTAFGISLLVLVLGTLLGKVVGVYSVAFYRSINRGVADEV